MTHFDLCPTWDSDDELDWMDDNSDCDDCALIAAAYDDGYREGWIEAGEDVMAAIHSAMRDVADRIHESLLDGDPEYVRVALPQEFR